MSRFDKNLTDWNDTHDMKLLVFEFMYQIHRPTLLIMKIDQSQIQFREYVSTGTELILIKISKLPLCKIEQFYDM